MLGQAGILFICISLFRIISRTITDTVKVPYVFQFYFQIFLFTYFIIFFD